MQANQSGKAVIFLDGIFRYVLFPGDETLYEFTTKDEVFDLHRKKMRNDIIKRYGFDPDSRLRAAVDSSPGREHKREAPPD